MLVMLVFVMGIVNFTLHKAVLSSRHPMIGQLKRATRHGRWLTMLMEFAVLVLALLFAYRDWSGILWAYAIYTLLNTATAWAIIGRKL